MRLFSFKGGMRMEPRKQRTERRRIVLLPTSERLYIPLKQHIGTAAVPVVRIGDRVDKGQTIARAQGALSVPLHAPTSGRIMAIEDYTAPHPSGLEIGTIVLEADGEERWTDLQGCDEPLALAPEQIAARAAGAGLVGMGGATFPSAMKLKLRERHPIHSLIVNGAECEPYATGDDRLMQERAAEVVDGVRILLRALEGPSSQDKVRAIIAIEHNKPKALAAMAAAAAPYPALTMVPVPTRYPMGSEKHLVRAVTGHEIPARALAAELGVLVHNVGTAYALHRAIRHGRPLISRVVTVSGGAIEAPQNFEVPIGTPVSALLRASGGVTGTAARLLMGGPMMGTALPHAEVPVVKGTTAILVLSTDEAPNNQHMPCIRCGTCVQVCPCGLMPVEMVARIRSGDLKAALGYGLLDCVGCGTCAYSCPSRIPLVQYLGFAKGALAASERAQHKAGEMRRLMERRQRRLEEEARIKAEAAKKKSQQTARKPPPQDGAPEAEGNRTSEPSATQAVA